MKKSTTSTRVPAGSGASSSRRREALSRERVLAAALALVDREGLAAVSMRHLEAALQVLRDAGFSAGHALAAFQILVAFVVGHTLQAYVPLPLDEETHPAYESLSEEAFPRVRELARLLPTRDVEEELALGVDALLDGLEGRLARGRAAE